MGWIISCFIVIFLPFIVSAADDGDCTLEGINFITPVFTNVEIEDIHGIGNTIKEWTGVNNIVDYNVSKGVGEYFNDIHLTNDIFSIATGQNFANLEEQTKNSEFTMLNFQLGLTCKNGKSYILTFYQSIIDTNNHPPEFNQTSYTYQLPMPFPAGITLTKDWGPLIAVRDIDISNMGFTFDIEPDHFLVIEEEYADDDNGLQKKRNHMLKSKDGFKLDATTTFKLNAYDKDKTNKATTDIIIEIDEGSSYPEPPQFSKVYYMAQYDGDQNSIDPPIEISITGGSGDVSVSIEPDDYFSVSNEGNSVKFESKEPIGDDILESKQVLVYTVTAQSIENPELKGLTVVVVELPPKQTATTTACPDTTTAVTPTAESCEPCICTTPTAPGTTECPIPTPCPEITPSTECPTVTTCPVCPTECPDTTPCPETTPGTDCPTECPTATTCPVCPTECPTTTPGPDCPTECPTAATCPVCPTECPTTTPGTECPTECPTAATCPVCPTECPTTTPCPDCPTDCPTAATCPVCPTECPTTTPGTDCPTECPTAVTCPACPTECPETTPGPGCPTECPTTCPACPTECPETTPGPECPTTCPACPTECPETTPGPGCPTECPTTCPACPTECPTTCPACPTECPEITPGPECPITCPACPTECPGTPPAVTCPPCEECTTVAATTPGPTQAPGTELQFTQDEYSFLLPAVITTPEEYTVTAIAKPEEKIVYELTNGNEQGLPSGLVFDSSTGKITIQTTLAPAIYTLTVKATGQETGNTATAKVILRVYTGITCDDELFTSNSLVTLSLIEGKIFNEIMDLNVEKDGYHYEIVSQNPPNSFSIDPATKYLTCQPLDREVSGQHEIVVELIKDTSKTSKAIPFYKDSEKEDDFQCSVIPDITTDPSRMLIVVVVGDDNDHPPVFAEPKYEFGYPSEDLIDYVAPMHLGIVRATDEDIGENAHIKYTIEGSTRFFVHPDTGYIYAKEAIKSDQEFTVNAIDQYGKGRKASVKVQVALLEQSHISIFNLPNVRIEDLDQRLEDLSNEVKAGIKYLSVSIVPKDASSKRSARDDGDDFKLKVVGYGIQSGKPIVTNDLQNLIEDNTEWDTGSLQDFIEEITKCTKSSEECEDDCETGGYIAAVVVLCILIVILLGAGGAFYYFKIRKPVEFEPVARRPTGFVFNPPLPEDDDDDEENKYEEVKASAPTYTNVNEYDEVAKDEDIVKNGNAKAAKERRKSVSFKDYVVEYEKEEDEDVASEKDDKEKTL